MTDGTFKLQELADAGGVTARTVRYYIAQGLMPSPGRLGANTRYDREHLERLRLIRSLQGQGLPLAEIRDRILGQPELMSPPMPAEASALAFAPMEHAVFDAPMAPALPRPAAGRTSWDRIVLASDLELHVMHPPTAETRRLVARILALAGGRA